MASIQDQSSPARAVIPIKDNTPAGASNLMLQTGTSYRTLNMLLQFTHRFGVKTDQPSKPQNKS